jgi:hypothetical protein
LPWFNSSALSKWPRAVVSSGAATGVLSSQRLASLLQGVLAFADVKLFHGGAHFALTLSGGLVVRLQFLRRLEAIERGFVMIERLVRVPLRGLSALLLFALPDAGEQVRPACA